MIWPQRLNEPVIISRSSLEDFLVFHESRIQRMGEGYEVLPGGGHLRVEVARALGMETVNVFVFEDITDADILQMMSIGRSYFV